jgi:hypothetical protein
MTGIISRDNAVEQLLRHYERADNIVVKEQIVNYMKEIWRRP